MFWKKKEQVSPEGLVWFSYAVMLPDQAEEETEVTVVGNMIIRNTGNIPLNNPMICIRIKPHQDVHLGGKIGSDKHTALMIDGTNAEVWHYFHEDWKEQTLKTGEHWLKPNHVKTLDPGVNVPFAYELRFSTTKKEKSVLVEGFFYSDELPNGIGTLNNMTINF